MATAAVITGMSPYTRAEHRARRWPRRSTTSGQEWAANLISLGAIAGITTVILVLLLGQSRVLFAMARDGLLPQPAGDACTRGSARRGWSRPWSAAVVAVLAAVVPLSELSELTSIGTLFAFVVVSLGVVVLRRTRPGPARARSGRRAYRGCRSPSVLACVWLMLNLPVQTWLRFVVWMVFGLGLYFVYGRRHSRMHPGRKDAAAPQVLRSGDEV